MNTAIVPNRTPAQQAARAAVAMYRAGQRKQAAQIWEIAKSAWSAAS